MMTTQTESADTLPPVLLVEDEPTTRLLATRGLQRAGYEVEAVANGAQALQRMRERYFPLLLTDWEMPEMDGLALCRAVRAEVSEGYVYTILLTAREGKESIIRGLQAGADDYLTKPFDDAELMARLNTGRRILKLERSLRAANQRNHLLATTDALTGAYNRRHLMDSLPRAIERAGRYHRPLSTVLCDVDHFKQVNDTHGHQVGDEVLKGFADLLRGAMRRDIDWLVRYGGEEFLVVLPETGVEDALAFADKIRLKVAAHDFQTAAGALRISASFGVAGYDAAPRDGTGVFDRLIAEADDCLYRAKEGGRNRTTARSLDACPHPPSEVSCIQPMSV
jgi:diguanylate cyclase (GGDEF)-like protein